MARRHVSDHEWQRQKPLATDSVSIKGLSHVLTIGSDIWGRQKPQPVSISIKIGLAQAFATASATDTVDASTVHYGQLSKSIFATCERYEGQASGQILDLGNLILADILGANGARISYIELDIALPKATRYGQGIVLSMGHCTEPQLASHILTLRRLAVPCIIGVNSHERDMKQMVIATISIDKASETELNERFYEIEQLVVKTTEESFYETLEALAEDLSSRVIKHCIWAPAIGAHFEPNVAGVRVSLEKPSAVPFAEAPVIEIYRSAQRDDPAVQRILTELGNKPPRIPFPLPGRLDEFLRSWKQD